jgi:hypothetical protein
LNYLCMVHVDEGMMRALTPEQDREVTRKSLAYDEELKASGHYIAANALQGPETATIVRVRNGKVSMHDGPHVETKEHLGGFILIDARDLNEALSIASKIPMANYGSVEVRPELTLEG